MLQVDFVETPINRCIFHCKRLRKFSTFRWKKCCVFTYFYSRHKMHVLFKGVRKNTHNLLFGAKNKKNKCTCTHIDMYSYLNPNFILLHQMWDLVGSKVYRRCVSILFRCIHTARFWRLPLYHGTLVPLIFREKMWSASISHR